MPPTAGRPEAGCAAGGVLFSWGMRAPVRVVGSLISLFVALLAPAYAQEGFKITYDVDQSRPRRRAPTGGTATSAPRTASRGTVPREPSTAGGRVVPAALPSAARRSGAGAGRRSPV